MNKTPNLNLPIYDTPDVDVFDLQDWNDANIALDGAYKQITDFKEEIPKVNASAEVLEARSGEETLGSKIRKIDASLEQKSNEINTLNTNKADISYVNNQISTIGNASPKGVYSTLTALQTAYPTGTTGIYLVTANGHWYYWNGSAWTDGGAYQSSGIAVGSITSSLLSSQFRTRTNPNNGVDLLSLKAEGNYWLTDITSYIGYPVDLTGSCVMNVSVAESNTYRWIFQEIYSVGTPELAYKRRVDNQNNTATAWKPQTVKNKSIEISKLTRDFSNGGQFSGKDLNTVLDEGEYFMIANQSYPNSPFKNNISNNNFKLTVKPIGTTGRWIYQEITMHNQHIIFTRAIDNNNPTATVDWIQNSVGVGKIKKVVHFGDSLTEFGNYSDTVKKLYSPEAYNVGFGGCQWAKHSDDDYDKFSMYRLAEAIATNDFSLQDIANENLKLRGDDNTTFLNRLKGLDFNTVDIITIFYGTNDFANGVQLGVKADTTPTTFYGAINLAIQTILTAYPHLQILLITPIFRSRLITGDGKNSDDFPNSIGVYLNQYCDIIREKSISEHLPLLDLQKESGVNRYTSSYWLADGVHLTPEGYIKVAGEKIARKLIRL